MCYKTFCLALVFMLNFSIAKCQQTAYKNTPSDKLVGMQKQLQSDRNIAISVTSDFYDITKSLPDNLDKTGSTDYTSIIQGVLLKHSKVIFPDFPVLVNDKGLNINSNSVLYFPENSSIKLKSSAKSGYQILNLSGVTNVKIYFPVLEGDKYTHNGKVGEWGMGISIKGSDNILIHGLKASKCWGDGLYIGALNNKPSSNINVKNSVFDDNRRNGISIVSTLSCSIDNVIISNTFGAQPMAGLDIEPNNNLDVISGLDINRIYTFNNGTCGILFMLNRLKGSELKDINIKVNNHIDDSSVNGVGFSIASNGRTGTKFRGSISIKNSKWVGNKNKGFYNYSSSIGNGLNFDLQDNKILDKSNNLQNSKMTEYNVIKKKYANE